MMKRWPILLLIAGLLLVISACSGNEEGSSDDTSQETDEATTESTEESTEESASSNGEEMTVPLKDADGEEVAEATLTPAEAGVTVTLTGDGVADGEGEHGFHVHEKGVCEAPDFKSASGHYNPNDANHGKEDPDGPHAGDFDNVKTDSNGNLEETEFTTDQISLDEEAANTVMTKDGTALVIHEKADDYSTQPSGDAGDRIACGVIAEPK
ncbi:hypothetical protein GCM10022378_00230 [Salinicoccus jeotgali]|uniref:Superoxide dismutase [Cu-Zn] n=1 Tax=Salinicoccus jeotgali TaxID=381634 RepID=A0ABP7E297_9STAP